MFVEKIERVRRHLQDFVREHFGLTLESLVAEAPPKVEFGDLAFPFPFELARVLKRSPRSIAEELAARVPPLSGVRQFSAAGGGYLNVFFDRVEFFRDLLEWSGSMRVSEPAGKIIVEHTNINPNKAAHIGHLRNAALGDSFVRLLRALGHTVEVQNYIDNTGVQVADVVVGFQQLLGMGLEQVSKVEEPFDYFCWDLYARVSDWYEGDPARKSRRHETLRALEEGRGEIADLAEHISTRIVRAHLKTMRRLGVEYDLLPRESEILRLRFWEAAFERLQQEAAVIFRDDGPHSGCWVMELPEEDGLPADEKIIVRSDGTVTYVGKDIAYQLWKFGLLGKTFHYEPFESPANGHRVWVTTSEETAGTASPEFGHGDRVYNVIDVRQSYLQRVVVQGLRRLGYSAEASRSTHFSYEMVALSPACCSELGLQLTDEDRQKPYIEVSGRRGLGVKADDLIDKLIEKAGREVKSRQPDLKPQTQQDIARQIAIGALRYFLLKYSRNSVIAFDFEEALSFEGETGPYLQYAVVRCNNIFRKLEEREDHDGSWIEEVAPIPEVMGALLSDDRLWELVLLVSKTEEIVQKSVRTLEISNLARHAFLVAQQFNFFYHTCHILSEEPSRRDQLLLIVDSVRRGLTQNLDLLGVEIPERM